MRHLLRRHLLTSRERLEVLNLWPKIPFGRFVDVCDGLQREVLNEYPVMLDEAAPRVATRLSRIRRAAARPSAESARDPPDAPPWIRRGRVFGDGDRLFSSGTEGVSIWDITDGARIGRVPGVSPTRCHRGARELVEIRDATMLRLRF